MIRGTTPAHEWELPFTVDMISNIEVCYKQNGKEVLLKRTGDFELSENIAKVNLTEEETFAFKGGCKVSVQLRVKTIDSDVMQTYVEEIYCYDTLFSEVMG